MKRYGFECEYWVADVNQPDIPIIVPKGLPSDECGYLVEARGEPHSNVLKAAHLMLAEADSIRLKANQFVAGKCVITSLPATRVLDKGFRREALARFGKNPITSERGNLYNRFYSLHDKYSRAGLHVHFSDQEEVQTWVESEKKYYKAGTYQRCQLNMPKIIRELDQHFRVEIKEANRLPGFYEIKVHGFEYRSLPASVNPVEVAKFITEAEL